MNSVLPRSNLQCEEPSPPSRGPDTRQPEPATRHRSRRGTRTIQIPERSSSSHNGRGPNPMAHKESTCTRTPDTSTTDQKSKGPNPWARPGPTHNGTQPGSSNCRN